MRKKKVLFHSNYAGAKTGFGGFMREILGYLYSTGKYDLTLFAAGLPWEHADFQRWPWKTIGTLPNNPAEMQQINRDPNLARGANYGEYLIDRAIQEVKPDVYIGVEDPWGVEYCKSKKWWGKIPCIVHTTLDSRPIYPNAIELAKSTPHFYSWADFATKELNRMGIAHAKTMRGSVNTKVFRRLAESVRRELREKAQIPADAFCFGMLSRNQLRKSFPNILQAYKQFKTKNPEIKNTRVLFYTHFSEGWNIPALCDEMGIDKAEVLATYKCRATGQYFVRPFVGQDLDNPAIAQKKTLVTVNPQDGLTEEQVNEWYNLLDVYVHAFTSGGQERGIQEAKLAELITLVTNYSCGEDCCVDEAASFPLEWDEYREPGTQFIKATTKPYSIVKQLERVWKMDVNKRREMGRKAREWALANFSIEVVGKKFEELLDSLPLTEYDFDFSPPPTNSEAVVPPIADHVGWIRALYKEILLRDVNDDDQGLQYWLQQLRNNAPRQAVEDYFRKVARDEQQQGKQEDGLEKALGPESAEDRVLITMPESFGDCLYVTALLKDAREIYADKKIYVTTKPEFMEIFQPLIGKYIDYVLPWRAEYDNAYLLEGACGQKKYFQIMLLGHVFSQRHINYLRNGQDQTKIKLHRNDADAQYSQSHFTPNEA